MGAKLNLGENKEHFNVVAENGKSNKNILHVSKTKEKLFYMVFSDDRLFHTIWNVVMQDIYYMCPRFLLLQPLLNILDSTKHNSFVLIRKQKEKQPYKEKGKRK